MVRPTSITSRTKVVNPDGTFTRPVIDELFRTGATQNEQQQVIEEVRREIEVVERKIVETIQETTSPLDLLEVRPYFIYAGKNLEESGSWYLRRYDRISKKIDTATSSNNPGQSSVSAAFEVRDSLTFEE